MHDYDNPLWQRPQIWDKHLQKYRYQFYDEISDTQKQAEINYQIRKNKELINVKRT